MNCHPAYLCQDVSLCDCGRVDTAWPSYLQDLQHELLEVVQPEFQQQSFLSSDGFGVASPSDVSVRSYTEDRVAKARRVAPGDGVARSSSTSVYAEPRRVDVWPRRVNVWGQTICCELLRHSQLVILQCTSRDLQEDEKLVSPTEVLAKCEPVANALHLWKVVILAAPKELLTLRGECRFAVCARHGVDTKNHPLPIIDEQLQILHCMHPSATIASLFPTLSCGVFVFRAVSAAPSPPASLLPPTHLPLTHSPLPH